MRKVAVVLLSLLLCGAAIAQDEYAARQAKVDEQIVKKLLAFGRRADGLKLPARARVAYQMVIDHYDPDHSTARKKLGFKRVKDAWQADATKLVDDVKDKAKLATCEREWEKAAKSIADLHGSFGLELHAAGDLEHAKAQLQRALEFRPGVREWHVALGHVEVNGFFGTEEQAGFVNRMIAMREKAREIAGKEYEVKELPESAMPAALRKSGLPFFGARSKHFTHWVIHNMDDAKATLQWAERAFELLRELGGSDMPNGTDSWVNWFAIVRTHEQRDQLLSNSPEVCGNYTLAQAKMFSGMSFQTSGGLACATWRDRDLDADGTVAHVTKRHLMRAYNDGLGEGVVHAMTWLLVGTVRTHFASLKHTVSSGMTELPRLPDKWRERLNEEIEMGKDWQLEQVPRERLDNFRDSARIKSWSFMVFLMARHPQQWLDLCKRMGKVQDLSVELVQQRFTEELGRSVHDVNAEWREWAKPGSPIGKASNW